MGKIRVTEENCLAVANPKELSQNKMYYLNPRIT